MRKFDPSSGLTAKEVEIIKYNIKKTISRQLPELPNPIETELFLQGRDAWLFNWSLLNESLPIKSNDITSLAVTVKLKKEFHCYKIATQHNFSCKVQMKEDIYHPKLVVAKKAA